MMPFDCVVLSPPAEARCQEELRFVTLRVWLVRHDIISSFSSVAPAMPAGIRNNE